MRKYLLFILAGLLLASCSGTRNLSKPELELPLRLAGNATDSVTLADVEWWKLYADSALVYIIRETLEHNRDLAIAAQRVEQMRELYGINKADFFPTVDGNTYYNRETNNYNGRNKVIDPENGLKFSLNWEIDLWGGLAWAKKRGAADFLGAVENSRALRITLIAEAASAYIRLLALDNELAIVRRTLFTREENLKKAKLRFEGGLTPETVYQQAQVEYASTSALIPGLERSVELQKNVIALLMGRYPEEEIKRSNLSMIEFLPESVPVGLPSTLMKRRPDIHAAEAALRSALASVGVSYADQFPNLRIGLSGGWENDDFKHFFSSPFTYVIGQITGTIFDFGRKHRRYKAAIAQYEQARLSYEKCVLTAFHEVDDAALNFRLTRQTTERRRELLEAARKYATLAYAQYNMGVINYIDVLDAQRRYFDAQVGVSNAVRDQYLALVTLYKCLGGGFGPVTDK